MPTSTCSTSCCIGSTRPMRAMSRQATAANISLALALIALLTCQCSLSAAAATVANDTASATSTPSSASVPSPSPSASASAIGILEDTLSNFTWTAVEIAVVVLSLGLFVLLLLVAFRCDRVGACCCGGCCPQCVRLCCGASDDARAAADQDKAAAPQEYVRVGGAGAAQEGGAGECTASVSTNADGYARVVAIESDDVTYAYEEQAEEEDENDEDVAMNSTLRRGSPSVAPSSRPGGAVRRSVEMTARAPVRSAALASGTAVASQSASVVVPATTITGRIGPLAIPLPVPAITAAAQDARSFRQRAMMLDDEHADDAM